ncbi:MAG TPA: ribonuclease P protein component 1 [Methanotrichaceae archaeon]|nr:ribonuclease P protein component 1 [Methanotrichaceae archaeon]HQF16995.1 ribonuclease P protein component 1 [Methanotrichaceae archaeon]HQI91615.1 ribonuclease P protein component 1 [Methanotrichaceae archaeon]HQJ28891.1 ribonuclease P protein component 1 [Methanotrichaceae archaeon]
MRASPDNLARHELIGLKVEVLDTSNRTMAGMTGWVVDETRNTFVIETPRGERRVPKAESSFVFTLPDGRRVRIVGSILISQPENRINKRMQRSRWKL